MDTTMTTAARKLIAVTLRVTTEDGQTKIIEKSINAGPTEVTVLKHELGVPEETSLWVLEKSGKKKHLADHETHNVKEGDCYEALVRGGVS